MNTAKVAASSLRCNRFLKLLLLIITLSALKGINNARFKSFIWPWNIEISFEFKNCKENCVRVRGHSKVRHLRNGIFRLLLFCKFCKSYILLSSMSYELGTYAFYSHTPFLFSIKIFMCLDSIMKISVYYLATFYQPFWYVIWTQR